MFVIGAAMAGLAGVLVTMNYGTFDFYIGFIIGIKAFTAAVLGGIGSLPARCWVVCCLGGRSPVRRAGEFGLQRCLFLCAAGGDPDFRPQGLLGRPLVAKV